MNGFCDLQKQSSATFRKIFIVVLNSGQEAFSTTQIVATQAELEPHFRKVHDGFRLFLPDKDIATLRTQIVDTAGKGEHITPVTHRQFRGDEPASVLLAFNEYGGTAERGDDAVAPQERERYRAGSGWEVGHQGAAF